MPAIRPFTGYLIDSAFVHEVVAPAYDSLTPRERHEFATKHPRNYLNVMRSLDEFPRDACPTAAELLASNAARLRQLIADSAFVYESKPCIYLYRLATDAHVQTGVVAEVPVDEYDAGRLKKHEGTRGDREDRLTRYLEVVGASSSPVCLAYRQRAEINALVDELMTDDPAVDFVSDDAVAHTIWRVERRAPMDYLTELFAAVPVTYLTDGHHRSAAASRFAAKRRVENPAHAGDEAYNYLLVALFPHDQLRIQSYNRCVKDLNGHALAEFLAEVGKAFEVEKLRGTTQEAKPRGRGEIAMCVDGCWYRLVIRPHVLPADDPSRALDVVILQERVLGPVLGIRDPRSDPRLEYIPGSADMGALESLCEGEWRVAFAAHPTSMQELMQIADTGEMMPPKSTWFDPKVRSGIFLCMR